MIRLGSLSGHSAHFLVTLAVTLRSFGASFGLIGLLAVASGCPSEDEATKPTPAFDATAQPRGKHAGKTIDEIQYSGTIAGLKRLMRDLRTAVTANDEAEMTVLVGSLRISDSEQWMANVFGDELGAQLSAEYTPQREEIGLLVALLKEQFGKGLTTIQVERFQTANVQTATGYQSTALSKMQSTVALYSVRLSSDTSVDSFHLWSFVHQGGSFRYVGKLRAVAPKRIGGGRDLNEYRLRDVDRIGAQEP